MLAYLSTAPATDILAANFLRRAPSADVIAAVNKYGTKYGIAPQTLLDIIAFETGGTFDPDSRNPHSSAKGLFQIMDDTWRELARRYGLTDVFDIDQNAQAGAINLSQAIKELSHSGIDASSEDQIYLAHQQGGAGAAALINNPELNAVDALKTLSHYRQKPQLAVYAIEMNGGDADMTAEQVFAVTTARLKATARRVPRISGDQ